ncbi:MAG: hypothetical protein ABFC57_04285 [Veillonellales bacterium]
MIKKKIVIAVLLSGFVLASLVILPVTQASPATGEPAACGPNMMLQRMADDWGLEKTAVEKYLQQGVNPHDLMHAALVAKAANKSLPEILSLKTLANTWGDVEQSLGITTQQIRALHEEMLAAKMAGDLSVPKGTVLALLKSGYIPPDIEIAAILAKNTQKPIPDILSLKKINNSWSDVAQSLGVDQETFRQSLAKNHSFMPGPGMHGPDSQPGPSMDDMYSGADRP